MSNRARRLARDNLAADVARFLDNGGRIGKIPNGACANAFKHIKNPKAYRPVKQAYKGKAPL